MRWAGHVARIFDRRDLYRILVGKREGKRPLWRTRSRWEDNINMEDNVKMHEVGCWDIEWIDLAQDTDR